jgi:hypothetical protein
MTQNYVFCEIITHVELLNFGAHVKLVKALSIEGALFTPTNNCILD